MVEHNDHKSDFCPKCDFEDELRREAQDDAKLDGFDEWQSNNNTDLMQDFIDQFYSDEFSLYCIEQYKQVD